MLVTGKKVLLRLHICTKEMPSSANKVATAAALHANRFSGNHLVQHWPDSWFCSAFMFILTPLVPDSTSGLILKSLQNKEEQETLKGELWVDSE